jgi:FlaA1/EpsC-like NDP-sugar epimerase
MNRLNHPVYRNRVLQVIADAALVAIAFYLAFRLRFLDDPHGLPQRYEVLFAQAVGFVVVGKVVVFAAFGLYQKWWRYVSGRDFLLIVRAVTVASAILVVAFTVLRPFAHNLPRSVAVMDFILTLMLITGARLAVRLIVERPSRSDRVPKREVLVVGAGSGGQMVVRELQLNPDLGTTAIGFVDDDPRKRGMRMSGGLKVLGSTKQIAKILDETQPDEVVIAIPSAPGTLRAKVVAACREREIRVRTLPTVFELLRGGVQLNKQLRDVQVEDVLGRDPIVVELDRVGAYLRDRIVLVTGAGGSIGSELCRQIARVGPRLLVMVDHAEDNLFEIDREMVEERHFTSVEAVLADCKEPHRMLETMQRFKPSVVFHAAAYKHVPLMEANPLEAVRNNAIATRITAETAAASDVERFVLISTDKAVNPKTVMGASKAMAEWIVESAGTKHPGTRFASVRFGNVLNSSGSVVPIFRSQIERGGPVTVTHPEMTRYFMTIPEAVQLVIRAGDIGAGKGEVFVLDMGEPVKIVDLAHNMIRLAGYEPETDVAVEFTKPRPGEKLHEELFGFAESEQPTAAKRIRRAVRETPLDPDWIDATLNSLEHLVLAGDEANLAQRVVEMITAPGGDAAAVVYDE